MNHRVPPPAAGAAGRFARSASARLAQLAPLARRVAPVLLALVPTFVLAAPLLQRTPLSYDHATHLFKAWHFWEHQLSEGRLRGWSHHWAFGSPSGELVPMGSEVWVALFRAMTFGQLSWLRTYALAFAGLLLFKALTAYCFTSYHFGRRAAIACAWIVALDPGGMLEGGWEWHTYWGVWPVTLAMSFTLMGLLKLSHVLERGRAHDALWAGLWCAAGLLTHPMTLLALAITAPLLLLDHLLRPGGVRAGAGAAALGALGLGGALAALYLLPFFSRSHQAQDLGWLGESLPVVSQKLVELRTFQDVWVPVHGLALLGAWFALRQRRPGAVFLCTSGAVLVILASGTLLRDLHLERALPTLIKIEANRFLLVAKLFWFPLAAYGAVQLVSHVPGVRAPAGRGRRVIAAVLAVGLSAALLAPGWRHFYDTQLRHSIVGEDQRRYFRDFERVFAWTREQRLATDEHFRVAYHMWRGEHLATLAPVFDDLPMYKIGYTPVQIYEKLPMTDEPELLEALSVKYVVAGYPLRVPWLKEERRFGALRVYRFERYRPEPFHLVGPGQGELLELSPEQVRVRLSGTAPGSRLVLHVASYERWQATIAGEELPIATVPALGVEYPMLMEVPARDGELVLRYVYRGIDWAGLLLALAALPAFAAVTWLARRAAIRERAAAAWARLARPLGWAALAGALLVTGVVAAATRTRARLLPPESIFHRVERPEQMTLGGEPCAKLGPLSFRCGAHRVRADVVEGVWGLHLCMTAPDAGELRVQVPTRLGSFLAGHYDRPKEAPGTIRVAVDGHELAALELRPAYLRHQRFQIDTRDRRDQLATVEVTLSGAARQCFDLETRP